MVSSFFEDDLEYEDEYYEDNPGYSDWNDYDFYEEPEDYDEEYFM